MNSTERAHIIAALDYLGTFLKNLPEEKFLPIASQTQNNNPWFTPEQTKSALAGLQRYLNRSALESWLEGYDFSLPLDQKHIGLVMAGNVPAVGFHDLICTLLSGHIAHVKLSSTDRVLIPWLMEEIIGFYPPLEKQIEFEDQLKGKDAYIATGSDNTSRYFEYYFGKYPHIIRKNRTSVAILSGDEDKEAMGRLGKDIFQYFGLGCRNVSKLYLNEEGQLHTFLDAIGTVSSVADHHKYINNYDYNKSIYLVNREPHLDNGFLLLKKSESLVSPIAVLYYDTYKDSAELTSMLERDAEKIQCVVSDKGWYSGSVPFGEAQCPGLRDYADHVDTLSFLLHL
jgi:hypothetical protein